jgi:hypothetical protein
VSTDPRLPALLAELRALEQLFANRVVITRVIVDPDGTEVGKVVRIATTPGTVPHTSKKGSHS